MENVKVALWGFGAMGSGIAKVLLRKKGVDIVGVCDIHPARVGRSIYELLEIDRGSRDDVLVNPKIEEVVHDGNCDICVIATDSFTRKAFNKIKFVVEQNVNVVSTAEEMSFPMAQEPELSAEMDKLAKEHGVSILGTGINPGLMMDLLAICLSGCMTDVEKVTCRRVNSLSPFGPAVMEEQGVGLSVNDFNTCGSRRLCGIRRHDRKSSRLEDRQIRTADVCNRNQRRQKIPLRLCKSRRCCGR